jgi:hypothetical protein
MAKVEGSNPFIRFTETPIARSPRSMPRLLRRVHVLGLLAGGEDAVLGDVRQRVAGGRQPGAAVASLAAVEFDVAEVGEVVEQPSDCRGVRMGARPAARSTMCSPLRAATARGS